jgi:hypothetical protein
MSIQLGQAARAILNMPYYKNQSARSGTVVYGHEDAVGKVLEQFGFTESQKSQFPGLSKSLLKTWAESGYETSLRIATTGMPVGSFIKQPAGSQGFPDILVLDFNNRFIAFECKSYNKNKPMWNDSTPKPNSIYIMNSGNYNSTTLFMGRDVISQAEQDLMDEQGREIEKIVNEYKAKLKQLDIYNRGFCRDSRKQYNQYGGGAKTDFFKHVDRAKCEQNVLNFCDQ